MPIHLFEYRIVRSPRFVLGTERPASFCLYCLSNGLGTEHSLKAQLETTKSVRKKKLHTLKPHEETKRLELPKQPLAWTGRKGPSCRSRVGRMEGLKALQDSVSFIAPLTLNH